MDLYEALTAPPRTPQVAVSLSMPVPLLVALDAYARDRHLSRSMAVQGLLLPALAAEGV